MPIQAPSDLARALIQIVLILGVARALALMARQLGQPAVVAEIVAGVLLGPSLLGWVWPDFFRWLFAPSPQSGLRLLSQLGLILFMFLVGLELDPKLLRGRAHTPVLMGLASILVPLALGIALAPWLHARYGENTALLPFASFLGIAMGVTAFPVLARILSERHLVTTSIGAIALTCAAVDDLVAWCLVTLLVGTMRAGDWWSGLRVTAVAVALVLVVLAIVRPLLTRWVRRLERQGAVGPDGVMLLLFPLLAMAAASELLGVHALFAAFIFGAVMPKQGAVAELLVDKLEAVTLTLLLPLFFAYSGLRTELTLLDDAADWLAVAVVVLVATAGKLGGSALVGRLTGLSLRDAVAIGILLNARGLMGLIVLNVGLDLGIIAPTLFAMLVMMALATTLLASPLLRLVFPDRAIIEERFASDAPRSLGLDQPPRENEAAAAGVSEPQLDRPDVVIACVSDPKSGQALASVAAAFASGPVRPSRVFGLHLTLPSHRASTELRRNEAAEPQALVGFLERARALALDVRSLEFVSSSPADDIIRIAEVKGASMLLLGAHEPWLLARRLDGVAGEVMRRTSSNVGVLIGTDRSLPADGRLARVLVACAGPDDDAALATAKRLAMSRDTRVTMLAITQPQTSPRSASVDGPWTLRRVTHHSPCDALVEEVLARPYDLVVVPLANHWGLSSDRFASMRNALFERIGTPLLIVHHGGESDQEVLQ